MTLLITLFAAIISTVIWYKGNNKDLRIGTLCWIYWGASLMWFIDACFEYAELHEEFFAPELADMLNDAYLGLSVVALGLVVWLVVLLIKDPKGTVKAALTKKN